MAEWENGLCSHICGGDFDTCMSAWFCSCFLHGRVSQRLDHFPSTEKPPLQDINCVVYWLSAGYYLSWVPQMLKREEFRNKFGIQGNLCKDCLASFCCGPCSMAQMNMEVKQRAEEEQRKKVAAYPQQQTGMVYQPPPPPSGAPVSPPAPSNEKPAAPAENTPPPKA